ncbi:unnamed protein product [Prorocentrum cordatum]|uniref:Cysteine-rich PDZ-binding protein n=1 Tax=Prorocentrum cordatum TaxID=2364126 RepID=A0ABN9SRU8_9DINO|nr:unnamed protein product [Polarella glacialis]
MALVCIALHAIELAKDHAMDELNKLHDDLNELSEEQAMRRRQRNHRLLTRLAPGRNCSNFALAHRLGHVCTDPEHIAGVLCEHWSEVFKRKDTDSELRNRWLAEEARHGDPDMLRHVPQADVPFEMFEKAIRLTSNNSPGPDGILFKAWRKLGRFAAVALYDAFVTISGPDGQRILEEDWDSFNESSMVFLAKKASGRTEDGSDIFTPNNMCPLNITNTDNRIICSAIRLHIELAIAPGVSMAQRGFIKGRSMLSNIVDIEEAMLSNVLLTLQCIGFASELTDARSTSTAAKCRVHRWENHAHGRLSIQRRERHLCRLAQDSPRILRKSTWSTWYDLNFLTNLQAANDNLDMKARIAGVTVAELLQGGPNLVNQFQRQRIAKRGRYINTLASLPVEATEQKDAARGPRQQAKVSNRKWAKTVLDASTKAGGQLHRCKKIDLVNATVEIARSCVESHARTSTKSTAMAPRPSIEAGGDKGPEAAWVNIEAATFTEAAGTAMAKRAGTTTGNGPGQNAGKAQQHGHLDFEDNDVNPMEMLDANLDDDAFSWPRLRAKSFGIKNTLNQALKTMVKWAAKHVMRGGGVRVATLVRVALVPLLQRAMVCAKCEKKLSVIANPDVWREGGRNNTSRSSATGGRKIGENMLLKHKFKDKANPYQSKCKVCKTTLHQKGVYCSACAYRGGFCAMCGKEMVDVSIALPGLRRGGRPLGGPRVCAGGREY